jgi:hypothetical protein
MNADTLRPFISRILSPFIAMLLTYLGTKFGISFGDDAQPYFTETITALSLPVFLALNAVIHKLLDKWINPGDAASAHLAGREKSEVKTLKSK